MPKPKMVCHDCNLIFNKRNNKNQVRTECYQCGSTRITSVTATEVPPTSAVPASIPTAPSSVGYKPPSGSTGGGGGLTAQMLVAGRTALKKTPRPVAMLPGAAYSSIPRGVRIVANTVSHSTVGNVYLCHRWRPRRNGALETIFALFNNRDLATALHAIACGRENAEHSNFGSEYRNRGKEMPTRRGSRSNPIAGLKYYEYGWKTRVPGTVRWSRWNNRMVALSNSENRSVIRGIQQFKQGKIFSERLIIAETGEIFYTPDHYDMFYRFHPMTHAWYQYVSAGGSTGPAWDESCYDDPYGS